MTKSNAKYVGVDGCPCGWVSIGLDGDCGYEVKGFMEFKDLVDYYSDASLILVDIPIGLPKEEPLSFRKCDEEARSDKVLGEYRSRVFRVASRRLVEELRQNKDWTYEKANTWSKKAFGGKGIGAQEFGIVRKTDEVDEVMTGTDQPSNVREVHPEVCYWALNPKGAVLPKKIKGKINPDGIKERMKVLRLSKAIPCDDIFTSARSKFSSKTAVGDDDILDALVAAVTAKLGCQDDSDYELRTLPTDPPKDCEGLPMEMVYAIKKSD